MSRRVARFTPAMIGARRRMLELEGVVKACEAARAAAEKRARLPGGSFDEYRRLMPPCGAACACHASDEAQALMDSEFRKFGITPWDPHGETEHEERMAELDRLAAPADRA